MKQKEKINPHISYKTIGMNLPMHEELMKKISIAALDSNLTKAAYVRQAIEDKLKKDGF
jgi:predicted DNA-binding protein